MARLNTFVWGTILIVLLTKDTCTAGSGSTTTVITTTTSLNTFSDYYNEEFKTTTEQSVTEDKDYEITEGLTPVPRPPPVTLRKFDYIPQLRMFGRKIATPTNILMATTHLPPDRKLEETIEATGNELSTSKPCVTSAMGLQLCRIKQLLHTVLLGYDPRFRPLNDQTRFVTIFSDFVAQSIIEFNTQYQRFTVMGYFKMAWRDDFLTWDKSAYGNTSLLRIPIRSLWTPKLIVDKANDGHGLVGDRITDIAAVSNQGHVMWFPEGQYSVVCPVTIRFYPYDTQTCTFTYFIGDEDNSTINLKHDGDVDLSEYIENAEWKLVGLTAECKQVDNVPVVQFHFNVERRGGFAMFTLIVPVLMLSTLSGMTFLIPIESGEKCGFSITIFLAYVIFETVVIDTLPHNSLGVSYFIIYLTSLVIVSILLTFYTILQAKLFDEIGNKQFRLLPCRNDGNVITWKEFLQKLDMYLFVSFLVVVIGCTSAFLILMLGKHDSL